MKHDCTRSITILRGGVLIKGCELCIGTPLQQGDSAAFYRRVQRADYRRDLVQPNMPDQYVKAWGANKARESGYTDEQVRRYS